MVATGPPDSVPPVDPDDDEPPRRLFGFAYWLAILFAIVCICAGYGFARYGAKLFPPRAPPVTPAPSSR